MARELKCIEVCTLLCYRIKSLRVISESPVGNKHKRTIKLVLKTFRKLFFNLLHIHVSV